MKTDLSIVPAWLRITGRPKQWRKSMPDFSVLQIDAAGSVIMQYDSLVLAAHEMKCGIETLHRAITDGRKFEGYYWDFS